MSKQPIPDLSTFYYWENFNYVLGYVKKQYQNLLSDSEIIFIQDFENLPKESQCLYLRLASRRALWFREEKLTYVEISNISLSIDELGENGFIRFASKLDSVDLGSILSVFSKKECISLTSKLAHFPKYSSTISKDHLVDLCKPFSYEIMQVLNGMAGQLICPVQLEYFTFIQFLFFGTKFRDMSEFVIRDLGHRQYVAVDEEEFVPYFQSRKEAIEKWKISLWRENFYEMSKDSASIDELVQSWNQDILPMYVDISDVAMGSFERALFSLGRWLERLGYMELALDIYEPSLSGLSLERRVRILAKLKRMEEALLLAKLGLEIGFSPKETHFFEDFVLKQNSKKHIKAVTQSLKLSPTLLIDIKWKGNVELGVIDYFENMGYSAHFTENHLWKNVLGILCWDLVFDEKQTGIHHPFQWAPSHYSSDGFTLGKEKDFEEKMGLLASLDSLIAHALYIKENHEGKLNPLIDWYTLDIELIRELVRRVPQESLAYVFRYLWTHLSTHAKGFPDLFIFKDSEYQFIEVKSPTDHLSAIQYFWHDFLIKSGIKFELYRVIWMD
ncbi:MAG: VRR-NUC domain-containing protein [Cytophagales bacterium]|nr:VRR-NUC domain-containing protein [Cytophagales bacterium]